jgi:replication-associated recombination protein RarA
MINPEDFEPKVYDDCLLGNQDAKLTLDNLISNTMPFPAFGKSGVVLFGPAGTGKTTLAKLIPAAMEVSRKGADSPWIDFYDCRHKANGAAHISKIAQHLMLVSLNSSGLHYVVLDEADNLTDAAQSQLKGVMNSTHSVFILTTNHLDRIDITIQNRSHLIPMFAAQPHQWLAVVDKVLRSCRLPMPTAEVLFPVIESCNGSGRDILTAAVNIAIKIKTNQPKVA